MYYMANTTSYMLKFGADATSVTKAITGVNSDIRSMSTQAKNLDTAFRLTGDTSALKGKLRALGNQLSATEAKAELLKQELANKEGYTVVRIPFEINGLRTDINLPLLQNTIKKIISRCF